MGRRLISLVLTVGKSLAITWLQFLTVKRGEKGVLGPRASWVPCRLWPESCAGRA